MRLHRLEVEGFGPFRTRQVVDFDAFADDGIFLIAGRTGAGKSSILDAVCFGLYGGVPRYDGGEKRLRSDHSAPDELSEVVVEFSTASGRYRVKRSPEYLRPAKRGGGMTKQAAAVSLDEHTAAGWIGRAARAVDVGHELEEILQLSREQFLQVILLAQNRFSEFLLANSRDRQALLRRLFGTERFEDVQARFDERRRASEQDWETHLAQVAARLVEAEHLVEEQGWGPDVEGPTAGESGESAEKTAETGDETERRIDTLRQAERRAVYRAERRTAERDEAERVFAAADVSLAEKREQKAAQLERDRSRRALDELDAEQPRIDEARRRLERARRAETLRGDVEAVTRASRSAEAAEAAALVAQQVWADTGVDLAEVSADALREWASAQTRESGAWARAEGLEAQATARADEVEAARAAVVAATAAIDDIVRERAELPESLALATTARDDARRRADRLDDLVARRQQAIVRRDAVQESERLATELAGLEQQLVEASTLLATAQTVLAQRRQRRLDGYAGELAAALVADEPCPVCGALEHPAPAEHVDPVSADDVAAAQSERDAAAERERGLAQRDAALRADLAGVLAAAEGRTIEAAAAELNEVDEELRVASDAKASLDALEKNLALLVARAAAVDDAHVAGNRALADAREALALREQSAREAEELIAEARGEFASVSERLELVNSRILAATRYAEALTVQKQTASVLSDAVTALDRALEESTFDAVAEIEESLLPAAALAALDDDITRHVVQREKEKSILLPLEMRALPEEPLDLAPIEEHAAVARAAWIAAVDTAGKATGAAERLSNLVESAAEAHQRSAEDAAEHRVLQNLADTIAGRGSNTRKMTLETFVLAAELEEIVEAANRRLSDMSTGRYQLQHSDALAARGAASGLGIIVFDAFTGQTRPAQSLSGGETFLSSLALALGLAEVVTARAGGIRLDTLFIDEGFGSLDGDTLDIAMRTLDELRQGGRTVGVISHVEAMQNQIPAQLRVRATSEGPSVIETT